MIAVDAMVVVAAVVEGPARDGARRWRKREPRWIAPLLWRSEVRNALAAMCRRGLLLPEAAHKAMRLAERMMAEGAVDVASDRVLQLASTSGCTAYDCEYVAVADARGTRLLTADQQILAAFPNIAVPFGIDTP